MNLHGIDSPTKSLHVSIPAGKHPKLWSPIIHTKNNFYGLCLIPPFLNFYFKRVVMKAKCVGKVKFVKMKFVKMTNKMV